MKPQLGLSIQLQYIPGSKVHLNLKFSPLIRYQKFRISPTALEVVCTDCSMSLQFSFILPLVVGAEYLSSK